MPLVCAIPNSLRRVTALPRVWTLRAGFKTRVSAKKSQDARKGIDRTVQLLTIMQVDMNLNNLTSFASEPTASKNILSSDVELHGTLKFESELIFDGKLDGEIISDGVLTLGKNAQVKGEIKTKSVTVHGTVNGNISVTERCELKASSQLNGDLKAMRIIIEEGATFIGKSEVTPAKAPVISARTATPVVDRKSAVSAESAA